MVITLICCPDYHLGTLSCWNEIFPVCSDIRCGPDFISLFCNLCHVTVLYSSFSFASQPFHQSFPAFPQCFFGQFRQHPALLIISCIRHHNGLFHILYTMHLPVICNSGLNFFHRSQNTSAVLMRCKHT